MKKEIPSFLPPLPKDHVYLGKGNEFKVTFNGLRFRFEGYCAVKRDWRVTAWDYGDCWRGNERDWYYCAHKDSEVVKLNNSNQEENTMQKQINPPFYVRTYGHEKLGQAVVDAAIKAGYSWFGGGVNTKINNLVKYGKKHSIYFDGDLTYGDNESSENRTEISIVDWFEYFEKNPKQKDIEIKLNDQYTAIVQPKTQTVKVGCQEFPFDKVMELASAISEIQKNNK